MELYDLSMLCYLQMDWVLWAQSVAGEETSSTTAEGRVEVRSSSTQKVLEPQKSDAERRAHCTIPDVLYQ